ncbi:MAG: thioredoxin [Lachnospiraceae bacterium]|jgi:thioredoxin 1|nr:thioredoxin [Lachnospiraceae bacterium]
MEPIILTQDNFSKEVLESDKPVLVDFWAAWCGPCKMLSPVVDQVAQESDAFKVCKLNVDDVSDIAVEYKVMSIPTLIVFKDGKEVKRSVGVVSKEDILAML